MGSWFSCEYSSIKLTAGLSDLRGLFKPKQTSYTVAEILNSTSVTTDRMLYRLEFFIQERIVKAIVVSNVIRIISFKTPQGTGPDG